MNGGPGVRTAATIGVFDGVHLGHRFLIERTVTAAREIGGRAVVFTFDPHPASVLAPSRELRLLTSTAEKIPRLAQAGADEVVVIHFDRDVSQLSPESFVDEYLRAGRTLEHLVIGHDFALGKNRSGDAARLAAIGKERGFAVTRIPAVRLAGVVVSSSVIREAIGAGDLDHAASLLGRRYSARARVGPGAGRGRDLGFATANLDLPPGKLMPPFGVYAVRAFLDPDQSGGDTHPAVMNFGNRPTFEGAAPVPEVHLLDFEGEISGRILEVEFVARIRAEQKFSGAAALVEQIGRDVERARAILRAADGEK